LTYGREGFFEGLVYRTGIGETCIAAEDGVFGGRFWGEEAVDLAVVGGAVEVAGAATVSGGGKHVGIGVDAAVTFFAVVEETVAADDARVTDVDVRTAVVAVVDTGLLAGGIDARTRFFVVDEEMAVIARGFFRERRRSGRGLTARYWRRFITRYGC
jgi:hypothetical protein